MMKSIDLTGQRFGRLTVIERDYTRTVVTKSWWKCLCDCGNICSTISVRLTSGDTKSCGCFRKERASEIQTTHGAINTSEYKIWIGIKNRCFNKNNKDFQNYGGRGITVCDRWKNSFPNFILDMGYRPSPEHSIDRYPDNDGNYEPGNCRWATFSEQANNRRNSDYREYNHEIKTVSEIAHQNKVDPEALRKRLYKGFTIDKAVETPFYRGVMITYNNEIKNITEWASVLGIKYSTLYRRIVDYGWSVDKAFITKVENE